jgi:AbrB family looped-hinge helix DNA binding protein
MSERVVVDKGGRIVIPKSMRQSLGVEEGDCLLVEPLNGALVIRPEEMQGGLVLRGGHLFRPKPRGARNLTTEDVRIQVEAVRMRGAARRKAGPQRRKKARA